MRKLEIKGALGVILLLAVMMGCDSTFSTGGGTSNVNVQYSINGDAISHNANSTRDYTLTPGGTQYQELTWFCGNYNEYKKSLIQLTFKKSNNTWVLDSMAFGDGSCR